MFFRCFLFCQNYDNIGTLKKYFFLSCNNLKELYLDNNQLTSLAAYTKGASIHL
jgi:hypothetical protein